MDLVSVGDMGNNGIGTRVLNHDSRVQAQRHLDKLKKSQKEMDIEYVIEELNGKKVVREYYKKKE